MWLIPRSHPRQVPYCSFLASMPHSLYFSTAQSLARAMAGEPVRRGPITSIITRPSSKTRERSTPSSQIARITGSSEGKDGAAASSWASAGSTEAVRPPRNAKAITTRAERRIANICPCTYFTGPVFFGSDPDSPCVSQANVLWSPAVPGASGGGSR